MINRMQNQSYLLILILFCALALSACGFQPLYGRGSAAQDQTVKAQLSSIQINTIQNREGQFLRNKLIDRLHIDGYPQNPRYILELTTIDTEKDRLDITKSANTTRLQVRLRTKMKLIDAETEQVLITQRLTAVNSYNVLESQFTTRVSERNAIDNALRDLAEQAKRHLALYFKK